MIRKNLAYASDGASAANAAEQRLGMRDGEQRGSNGFEIGMDVSFLDEIESEGGKYYDADGREADLLALLRESGVGAIRLRVWNEPPGGYCSLERTLPLARRIKALGLRLLIDLHYSDGWADPAKQIKPAAWEKLGFDELKEAVRRYTFEVVHALAAQGTPPDTVQIGNEITPGMLWNDGRVDGEFDTAAQWAKLAALVKAGIAGAREASPRTKIMIHIDRGGDFAASKRFFDRLLGLEADFDCIGLSYYPWWHGTLADMRETLHGLAVLYGKPLYIVETAYPWTLEGREGLGFIVSGQEQLHEGYPASPEGQARYLRDFADIVRQAPNGLGAGFYWWEPAWIPSKEKWSVGHPNNWSNLTLFDFDGRKLRALDALRLIASRGLA